MAIIKPFNAIRPMNGWEDTIAALPYDVYSRHEAKVIVSKEPHSFLSIDRPETSFPDDYNMYSEEVYKKAREIFDSWIKEGSLIKDEKPYYYIYELIMNGRSQTGIVATAAIDDYLNNVIKKHENIRAEKELDRINHINYLDAQTGPIFLAYRANKTINDIVCKYKNSNPLYSFTKEDNITHNVWIIDNSKDISILQSSFEKIDSIYIADGHHRCASAVNIGLKRRNELNDSKSEFNYFLSVLFPDNELYIMDYNRVIKDLNGLTETQFLNRILEYFIIKNVSDEEAIAPSKKGEISLYIDNKWYLLLMKSEILSNDVVDGLDVSILQKYVLDNILDIKDPKTDKRIDFVGGIRGLKELERRVKTDCKAAFAMYPTSIQELFAIADAGLLMPPKSTWFEPKLRSGIFIHDIR